ncbi:MAG: type II toxin-antitoxin system VapC family toxin [Gammaproteobacteria bacterium]|nr:type II toxin-antitoxin system VapC family toxin [Gammaproteobacteria bacterium]
MMIICDTHVLIFWAHEPERISPRALRALEDALPVKGLACSDISFWEIAMLFARKRIVKPVTPDQFMRDLIMGMGLTVLPITPEIAVHSQNKVFLHKDPADRLIAATALHHKAPLITADERLHAIKKLETIW